MKEYNKSVKLEHVAYDIRGPVLEEAMRMRANGEKILRLNTGNPAEFGFTAPDEVIHDLIMNARDSEGYSDSKGIFSARKAIMQYSQLKKIPNVEIDDIYIGNGVSELIVMSMQGLLDNGDEVLVPMPDYPLWTAAVSLAGGNAVHYVCDEEAEWYPDIEDIKSKITSNTKAIVVINPNNPTGALYPDEILLEIVEIARQHGLIIFADEIYDRLVMDGAKHTAIASLAPDLFCVSMNGLSKSPHRGLPCGLDGLVWTKTPCEGLYRRAQYALQYASVFKRLGPTSGSDFFGRLPVSGRTLAPRWSNLRATELYLQGHQRYPRAFSCQTKSWSLYLP